MRLSWACTRVWAKSRTKFEWRPFSFFFALHLISGKKSDWFLILIFFLKFSEIPVPPPPPPFQNPAYAIGSDVSVMTYSDYAQFSVLYHRPVLQKKQLLYLRWLLSSLFWYLTEGLILFGLFYRTVGLTTKCATVKISEHTVEEEPPSQTRLDMTNTKNKTLVECVNKNSRRLICLTNQLKILHRAASKVFSWCLSSTPIPLLPIETQLLRLKIA